MLLLKAAGIEKGSGTPNKEKKGKVTEKQILEIAKQKMPDMNAASVEAAAKTHSRHRPLDGHRRRRLVSNDSQINEKGTCKDRRPAVFAGALFRFRS